MSQVSGNPPWKRESTTPPYLLPPLEIRGAKEEERTRIVVDKDVEAFCPVPSPGQQTPWMFKEDGSIRQAGELLASQTALPPSTLQLSKPGQGDGTYLTNPTNIQQLAKESESSFANELIKDAKASSSNKDRRASRDRTLWQRTDYTDTRPYNRTKFDTEKGKPFKWKWEEIAPELNYKKNFFDPIKSDGTSNWLNYNVSGSGEAVLNAAKREGSLGVDLGARGSVWEDEFKPGFGKIDVKAGSGSAKFKLGASGKLKGTPDATIDLDVGLEVNLVEAKYETDEIQVRPMRAWNFFVPYINKTLDAIGTDRRVGEASKSWDWGIYLKGEAGGQIGAGVKAEGKAGRMDKGRWGARAKVKASWGLGGALGGDLGVVAPD